MNSTARTDPLPVSANFRTFWGGRLLAAAFITAIGLALAIHVEGAAIWLAPLLGAPVVLGLVTNRAGAESRVRSARGAKYSVLAGPADGPVVVESPPQVSVVIPALNEARNLERVLRDLPEGLHEVVLVDGGSSDDTIEVAREVRPSIHVVTQTGRGKGDALQEGFAAVTGNVIVTLDADGSADPAEIPRFVDRLYDGVDFAKGTRFVAGGGSIDITWLRRFGNSALVRTVNVLFGTRFTDLCYGYNAFWTSCLPYISVDSPGFEVETLINLRMAKAGMRICEVPSYERARLHGNSHLNTFRDGLRVLRTILREFRLEFVAAPRPTVDSGRSGLSSDTPS